MWLVVSDLKIYIHSYTCHSFSMKNISGNIVGLGTPAWSWAINSRWSCLNRGVGPDALQQSLPSPAILWFHSQKSLCVFWVWIQLPWHWLHHHSFSLPAASSAALSPALWFWLWNLNFHLENTYLSPLINCNLSMTFNLVLNILHS